jgi:hypothetical protein
MRAWVPGAPVRWGESSDAERGFAIAYLSPPTSDGLLVCDENLF